MFSVMVEGNCQSGASRREPANAQETLEARSVYDLSVVGLVLLAPIIVAELWFATYDSHYLRRHFSVEFGSRFTGDVYTASVHCPHAERDYTPMFRAWNDQDAATFLEERHSGCRVSDVLSGGKVYRKRIWQNS